MTIEERIQEAYPASAPSETARAAAKARMVEAQLAKRGHTVRHRWRLALVAGVIVAVGGVAAGPKAVAAYRLQQIAGSLNDVRSAVIEQYDVEPDGRKRLTGTTYYQEGRWRIEGRGRTQIYEAPYLWIYDPEAHRVTKYLRPKGPFGYNASGLSVRAMLDDFARWEWKQEVRFGSGTHEGQRVDKVTITRPGDSERMVVLADPETHLPVEYQMETLGKGGWRLRGVALPRFNSPVDRKLFAQSFPQGTQIVDDEKRRGEWRQKIETPIATLTVGRRQVGIREVTVNARGHVFVIFTDGETLEHRRAQTEASKRFSKTGNQSIDLKSYPHPKLTLRDSAGTTYLESASSLQPYVDSYRAGEGKGIVLSDGQILQGAWFIPERQGEWSQRKITISAGGTQGQYTVKVKHPEPELIPSWMSAVEIGPHNDGELQMVEGQTLRPGMKARGEWGCVVESLRADLSHIEALERKGIAYAKQSLYFELYEALKGDGKAEDARRFLRLAAEEPVRGDTTLIDRAMKAEGLR